MLIIRGLLLSLLFISVSFSTVVFENNRSDSAEPFRSPKLKEIAETMSLMTQQIMDSIGDIDSPYSNVEEKIVVNVFLYDIQDGADSLFTARSGYFNPIDQLKTNGFTTINNLSNFGNIIYLDIGFWDPTLHRSVPIESDGKVARAQKLYGNENYFYQNFARYLHELINFQAHNPRDNNPDIITGKTYMDYNWLRNALGYFTAFRATRGKGETELNSRRVGVGEGLYIQGTTRPIFNTCGAAVDFSSGICTVGLSNLDISLQSTVFPVLRTLYHHNSFLNPSTFYIKDLPSLFYADIGPVGLRLLMGDERTDAEQQTFLKVLEEHISKEDIASGLGFLTLMYAWEQLEYAEVGKGDLFIKKLIQSDVKSFYVNDDLSKNLIISKATCDLDSATATDKICTINRILKNEVKVDSRTFEDYFFDMGSALFMDEQSTASGDITSFQFRNFNFSDLDQLYAEIDPNLTTGTRKGMNFVRVVKDVLAVGGVGGIEQEVVPDAGADQGAEPEAEPGLEEDAAAAEAAEQEFLEDVNQVEANLLSGTSLDLTTYSIGYVKLENKRAATADLNFTFDDTGFIVGNPSSITLKSRKLDTNDSQPRFGTTTYKVARSSPDENIATSVIMFQGLAPTNVKFNDSKAAFSSSKVDSAVPDFVKEAYESGRYSFRQELISPHFDPYQTESNKAIFNTSGIKGFGDYRTIWQKKASESNDPIAFREYTFSFKTVDFSKTTTLATVIEERTGILKESIEAVGNGKPFVLNLWVDQVNLSPCDASITTNCKEASEGLNQPPVLDQTPDPIISLEPEKQTIAVQQSLLSKTEANEVITISGRLDKILTISNPFDEVLELTFHLPTGGRVSDRFTIGSEGNSSILRLAALDTSRYKVMYRSSVRNAVQKAVNQIDQVFRIDGKTTKNLLIINRGQDDESLIVRLQKVSSVSSVSTPVIATQGGGGGGCFIATASFGSIKHPVVQDLIWFRDYILLKSSLGKLFVNTYYHYSPTLASWIKQMPERRWMGMLCLLPLWILVLTLKHSSVVLILTLLLLIVYRYKFSDSEAEI